MNRFKAGLYNVALMGLIAVAFGMHIFLSKHEDPIVRRFWLIPTAVVFGPLGFWFYRKAQEAEYGRDDEDGD